MNREINFRVWDIKNKKFTAIAQDDVLPPEEDVMQIFKELNDEYCFLQFAGLIDVAGRKVYEGDIVEYFHWCYANGNPIVGKEIKWENEDACGEWHETVYYPCIGEVKWNNEYSSYEPLIFSQTDYRGNCFAFVCKNNDTYGFPNSKGKSNFPHSYYKVIGNIFENPELLK